MTDQADLKPAAPGPYAPTLDRRAWFTYGDDEEGEEWGARSSLWQRLGIAELLGLDHND